MRSRLCRFLPVAATIAVALQSWGRPQQLFQASRPAMGTRFNIYLYAASAEQANEEFEVAFDEIERVEEALSNYRTTSELSRINVHAGTEAVTTDPEVFAFLQRALDFGRLTNGAFDVTVGPLMRAWGFFRGQGHHPSAEELARVRSSIGWRHVQLDPKARTVRFQRPGTELDLGGIGKGYAVDCVAALLRADGVKVALIDAGSSTMYALGAPPGVEGWKVQVPRPGKRTESISTVMLRDESLSTSGNYEKFFTLNGHVYGHIMDPRTGEPVQGVLQTTVIVPDGTASDALSTAMFVMGPQAGIEVLKSIPHAQSLWVLSQGERPVSWHWRGEIRSIEGQTVKRNSLQNKGTDNK